MSIRMSGKALHALLALATSLPVCAAEMSSEIRAKVEASAHTYQSLGKDPQVVAAVKAYNTAPPAEARAMTNEKWKTLQVLDPYVRSFSRNALAEYLKTKRDGAVSELFVSGADGGKVAFLAKTTNWTHQTSAKHTVPMAGKTWFGPVEVDESTGQQQVQVAVPVLDGAKPVGSLVVGLSIAKLK